MTTPVVGTRAARARHRIGERSPRARDGSRAARLFQALADEKRFGILEVLKDGSERCVSDLQADLHITQSRLSFHVRVLRDAGLIAVRRKSRWCCYHIVPSTLDEVSGYVREMRAQGRSLPVLCEPCCR